MSTKPEHGLDPGAPYRLRFLGFLAGCLIRLYSWTIPCRREGEAQIQEILAAGDRLVFCFWHGRQVLCAAKLRISRAAIMISRSPDGEIMARALAMMGHVGVRGSSGQGGRGALDGSVALVRQGWDAGVAVDGSRGPRGRMKVGAVVLAQRTGASIVPVGTSARWARIFPRSWDRFLLPLPFLPAALVYGEPIPVPADADRNHIEEIRREAELAIHRATRRADEICERETHDEPDGVDPAGRDAAR